MKERIIDYIPVTLILGAYKIPPNTEIAFEKAVCNASGSCGALIKHLNTGIYSLYNSGIISSIDQKFARKIAKI